MVCCMGEETVVFGDAGYQGIKKRSDAKAEVTWHVAMRPRKPKTLDLENAADALIDKAEDKGRHAWQGETSVSGDPKAVGHVLVRYWGLKKNTAQLFKLFALSSLWTVRDQTMGVQE